MIALNCVPSLVSDLFDTPDIKYIILYLLKKLYFITLFSA
jgi:hypothetical protein